MAQTDSIAAALNVRRLALPVSLVAATVFGTLWARSGDVVATPVADPAQFRRAEAVPYNGKFTFTRIRYGSASGSRRRGRAAWDQHYPEADLNMQALLEQFTAVSANTEGTNVFELEDRNIFRHPIMLISEPGTWGLSEEGAANLREYLLKGGFLMTDDFHGSMEWEIFMLSLQKVFPDRPVKDIPNSDPIFHVLYDLDDRFQIPGIVNYPFDQTYEYDGVDAHWRGIYDDNGRIMVAICHNMDMGDAWEWADSPHYPEKYASLAYRIGINYITYAMSH